MRLPRSEQSCRLSVPFTEKREAKADCRTTRNWVYPRKNGEKKTVRGQRKNLKRRSPPEDSRLRARVAGFAPFPYRRRSRRLLSECPTSMRQTTNFKRVISLSARTSTRVWKRRKSPFKVGSTITVRSLWIKTEPLRLSRVKKRKSEKVSFHGLRYGYAQKLKERLDSEGVKNAAKQVSRVSDTTVSP